MWKMMDEDEESEAEEEQHSQADATMTERVRGLRASLGIWRRR